MNYLRMWVLISFFFDIVPRVWWNVLYNWHSVYFFLFFFWTRICRNFESSFWVKIPILQDYQLLNKHYCYIFLYSDHNSKHVQRVLIGKILEKLYPISVTVEVGFSCLPPPYPCPSGLKHSSPMLLGVLITRSSGLMIMQLARLPGPRPSSIIRGVPTAHNGSVLESNGLVPFP